MYFIIIIIIIIISLIQMDALFDHTESSTAVLKTCGGEITYNTSTTATTTTATTTSTTTTTTATITDKYNTD
jgi:hypothetical protein